MPRFTFSDDTATPTTPTTPARFTFSDSAEASLLDKVRPLVDAVAAPFKAGYETGKQIVAGNFAGSPVGGYMRGAIDPVAEATNIYAHATNNEPLKQKIAALEAKYQEARTRAGRGGEDDIARMVGNLAGPVAFVSGRLAQAPKGMSAVKEILTRAAPIGVATGSLTPTEGDGDEYWTKKQLQAGIGAAVGPAATVVGRTAARVISPKAASDPITQKLLDEGVPLTPPQALGGKAAKIELAMRNLFPIGDTIEAAHEAAEAGLNSAILNKGMTALGRPPTKKVGYEGFKELKDAAQADFNRIIPQLSVDVTAPQLTAARNKLLQDISTLPGKEQKVIRSVLSREIDNRVDPNAMLNAEKLQDAIGGIRQRSRDLLGSGSSYEREAGRYLRDYRRALDDAVNAQNPAVAPELARVNTAWRIYDTATKAAAIGRSPGGVFSPKALQEAIYAKDWTANKRAFGEGGAFLQDIADAALRRMGTERLAGGLNRAAMMQSALGAGVLGAGGIYAAQNPEDLKQIVPPAATAAALTLSAYSPTTRKLVTDLVARRRKESVKLADLVRGTYPVATPGIVSAFEER